MTIRTISQLLEDVNAKFSGERVSINQILEEFHERGFGFFLFFFALPMAMPFPVPPGINVLLASPLLLLTAQQAMGRHTIWLPAKIRAKTFDRAKLAGLINKTMPWMQRIEVIIKPRLGFITRGLFSHVIGALGFIMALAVCVPIPMTNTIPSLGIALMAVGVIMRDGLAVLAGAIIGSGWVLILVVITLTLGVEGIDVVKEAIRGFL